MLHLLAENQLSQAVSERLGNGDDLVLQAGSIWAAFVGHTDNGKLLQLLARQCRIFILQDQMLAAGIAKEQCLPGVCVIDYSELVELTVRNSVIHTWC